MTSLVAGDDVQGKRRRRGLERGAGKGGEEGEGMKEQQDSMGG